MNKRLKACLIILCAVLVLAIGVTYTVNKVLYHLSGIWAVEVNHFSHHKEGFEVVGDKLRVLYDKDLKDKDIKHFSLLQQTVLGHWILYCTDKSGEEFEYSYTPCEKEVKAMKEVIAAFSGSHAEYSGGEFYQITVSAHQVTFHGPPKNYGLIYTEGVGKPDYIRLPGEAFEAYYHRLGLHFFQAIEV